MTHICKECGKTFTRKYNRDKHYQKKHIENFLFVKKRFNCPFCAKNNIDKHFPKKELLVQHVNQEHLNSLKYDKIKSAFDGKITLFRKKLVTLQTLENFVSDKKNFEEILKVILFKLSEFDIVKVALILAADYRIPSIEHTSSEVETNNESNDTSDSLLAEERDRFTLRTKREIFNVHESEKSTRKKVRHLLRSLFEREQDLLMRGSGWQFETLHLCDIEIVSHNTF